MLLHEDAIRRDDGFTTISSSRASSSYDLDGNIRYDGVRLRLTPGMATLSVAVPGAGMAGLLASPHRIACRHFS